MLRNTISAYCLASTKSRSTILLQSDCPSRGFFCSAKFTLELLIENLADHAISRPATKNLLLNGCVDRSKPFAPLLVNLANFSRLGADNCVWDIKTVPTQVFIAPTLVTQGSNDPIGAATASLSHSHACSDLKRRNRLRSPVVLLSLGMPHSSP